MNWPGEYKYRLQVYDPEIIPAKPFFDQLYASRTIGLDQFRDWVMLKPECTIKLTKCIIDPNTRNRLDMEVLQFHEAIT